MPARHCHLCRILYPVNIYMAAHCPVHGQLMSYRPIDQPDEDWQEKMQERGAEFREQKEQLQREQAEREAAIEAQARDGQLIPDVPVEIIERNGRFFISSHELIRLDTEPVRVGELIRIEGEVYEVQGYVDSRREYWVRRFSMELSKADLRKLARGKVRKPRGEQL